MRTILAIITLIFIGVATAYSEDRKVALLIGVEDYSGEAFKKLPTSGKDAETMGNMLESLGFETTIRSTKNANRDEMVRLLEEFEVTAKRAKVALFYYSGHGLSKTNRGNSAPDMYLVPSGSYEIKGSMYNNCIALDNIRKIMDGTGAEIKICIIDACRNSFENKSIYLPEAILDEDLKSVAKLPKVKGCVYFFSSGNGERSIIGDTLSVFTDAFVNHLSDPESMDIVWNRIQSEVSNSYLSQHPECFVLESNNTDNLLKDIYFNPNKVAVNTGLVKDGKEMVRFDLSPSDAQITFTDLNKTFGNGASVCLEFGKNYRYVVSANGYQDLENSITLYPSSQKTKSISLNKSIHATLKVTTSNAKNSEVYFDGVYKGKTPLTISTISGDHKILIKNKNFYKLDKNVNLTTGDQEKDFILLQNSHSWQNYNAESFSEFSYHFSPKMPIGLSYLYTPEDSRFSYGALVSLSADVFAKLSSSGTYHKSSESISIGNGENYREVKESIDFDKVKYSSEIDPNGEAKQYERNFSVLALGDYHINNAFALELGLGVSAHKDLYKMEKANALIKTSVFDLETGSLKGEPTYSTEKTDITHVYKSDAVWSPAFRFGLKFYIPTEVRYYDNCVSVGIGYTYNPKISEMNSIDLSLGFRLGN